MFAWMLGKSVDVAKSSAVMNAKLIVIVSWYVLGRFLWTREYSREESKVKREFNLTLRFDSK